MPRLMTIEGDYSLSVIEARGLTHEIFSRDAGGFFGHIWHVNPLVGADASEPERSSSGPPELVQLRPGHVVVEGHIAISQRLKSLPPLNLLLAQLILILRLSRIIRQEKITVVRAGDPYYLGLLAYLLSKLHRLPLVVKVNGNYDDIYRATGRPAYPRLLRSRSLEKRLERFILKRADLVATGNANNRDYALRNSAPAEKTEIFRVGSWIDSRHFEQPPLEIDLISELGLSESPIALFVGRLEPLKHPEDAIHALFEAIKRSPQVRLLMVGDGSMRGYLENLVQELRLERSVCFSGPRSQEEVRSALVGAAVVLAPLAGRALVEAALSGRPIIAYDVEWHSELLDEESGVLVPYRDAQAMGRAISELVSDPESASRLGGNGRKKCLEMMDPTKLASLERRAYERLERATKVPK